MSEELKQFKKNYFQFERIVISTRVFVNSAIKPHVISSELSCRYRE